MGALHDGHLSLIQEARKRSDVVVCSIFVNPTQFNDPSDLDGYPRQLEADMALLKSAGCDEVFTPDVDEMYAPHEAVHPVNYGLLTQTLEAAHRPGHFDGVVAIVRKLFEAVQPDVACFGQKDFQQLAIIRELARREFPHIEVVGCPIIREEEGLAMSSRNALLTIDQRQQALALNRTLQAMVLLRPHLSPEALQRWGWLALQSAPGVEPEYLEVVSQRTLEPTEHWRDGELPVVLVAAFVGAVRLIDNRALPADRARASITGYRPEQAGLFE